MGKCNLTREEQETVILGNAANRIWEIVTADPKMIRRFKKQEYKPDDRPNPCEYVSLTLPLDRVKIAKADKRKASGKPFALKNTANSRVGETQSSIKSLGQGEGGFHEK